MAQSTNNPAVQQIASELISRMRQGVDMHEQLADYYNFLNLPGYQKCHEYHMLCELLTYEKAKDEYMKEYNQLVPIDYRYNNYNNGNNMNGNLSNMGNNGNNANNGNNSNMANTSQYAYGVIPTQWYAHTRYDVDANTKRNGVRDGMQRWVEYEKENKKFLVMAAKKLEELGEREAARKMDFLIDHANKEIEEGEQKLMNLESAGYDMGYILNHQEELQKKYARKMEDLTSKDFQYRRRGQGSYANYNMPAEYYYDDEDDFDYRNYARGRGGRR